ncbi:MAG: transporter substrate-binding domain-containing protein [Clostridia bacterium]|nr:transporter substrate-binding domain-containing protein [Clostridia bacterium]
MKKLLTTLVAVMLAVVSLFTFTACGKVEDEKAIKTAGKIVIGITDYEPMDYKDENGKWIGFDAELAEMFAEELGVACEFFEIADWDAKTIELKSNQFDLIWNGMTASDKLAKEIDLSIPYAKNAQVLIVKSGVTVDKDNIKNMSIAVEKGSAGNNVAADDIKVTNINAVASQLAALLEVKAGTSDGALIDLTMAESVVGKDDFASLVIADGISYGAEVFSVGLRKNSDLTEKLNAFLKAKYADGTMTELLKKYQVSLNVDALK